MYTNLAILLDALLVSISLSPSFEFIRNHDEDAQKGEIVEGDIQTFCNYFRFQLHCRHHSFGHQSWLVSLCVETRDLGHVCLSQFVSGRSGVDASQAFAGKAVWCKVSLAFRLASCKFGVWEVKFFADFDVLGCNELKREGRNLEAIYDVRPAAVSCVQTLAFPNLC